MAYDQNLATRLRDLFSELPHTEEKEMMGGVVFMYNGKMCVGIMKEDLMCRVDPGGAGKLLEHRDAREMTLGGRPMKGYILVSPEGVKSKKALTYWVGLALAFNPQAKASKKKK